jgi:hypothetical protein
MNSPVTLWPSNSNGICGCVGRVDWESGLVVVPKAQEFGKVLSVLLKDGFGIAHAELVDLADAGEFASLSKCASFFW